MPAVTFYMEVLKGNLGRCYAGRLSQELHHGVSADLGGMIAKESRKKKGLEI